MCCAALGRAKVKPIFLPLMNYAPEEDDVGQPKNVTGEKAQFFQESTLETRLIFLYSMSIRILKYVYLWIYDIILLILYLI